MSRAEPILPALSAATIRERLTFAVAVEALRDALVEGRAPGRSPLRTSFATAHGELLLMPAEAGGYAGVKLASVGDGFAGPDVPRVQGLYVLFDSATLAPLATLDAVALTGIRTAAVSALAVDVLAAGTADSLLVFGSGPQAWHHVHALHAVRPLRRVRVAGRSRERVDALVSRLVDEGFAAVTGGPGDVGEVDLVACCTTAGDPLFDSRALRAEATVVAVGSHDPGRREVDAGLVAGATTIVESRASAVAEAGDVVMAVAEGVAVERAVDGTLRELVTGDVRAAPGRPRLFKSVGEAWEDLCLAAAVFEAGGAGQTRPSM